MLLSFKAIIIHQHSHTQLPKTAGQQLFLEPHSFATTCCLQPRNVNIATSPHHHCYSWRSLSTGHHATTAPQCTTSHVTFGTGKHALGHGAPRMELMCVPPSCTNRQIARYRNAGCKTKTQVSTIHAITIDRCGSWSTAPYDPAMLCQDRTG